jgi:uncharacterized membrane protein
VRCFGGQEKADDGVCTAQRLDQQTISLFYGHLIEYGDNVTLDTQLSTPNQLQLPSQSDQMAQTILDNLWIGLLALPLVVSWFVWFRWGRDWEFVRYNIFDHSDRAKKLRAPFSSRSPSLVYEPLDISPGLANAIMTERYTTRSLVGDIVDLAHQHFLKIEQIQEKSLFKAADYTFTKEGLSPDRLPAHQQLLLTKIFTKSDVIKLSALKGEFVSAFAEIQKKVHEMLWKDGYYTRNPAPAQGLTVVGFMLLAVTIGLLFASGHFIPFFDDTTMVIFIGLGIADFLAAMACALNLVQKTAKGSNYRMQAVGLRHTIQHGAWREKIMEKHLFFEDMLPFAIAFGVVDQLTKNMKDLNVEPPTYVGALNSSTFYAGSFAQSFTNDIGSNLTYNPSSSSWSGGGGGFSGGGGGGGGGGSW